MLGQILSGNIASPRVVQSRSARIATLSRRAGSGQSEGWIDDRTILVPYPLGALDNFVNEIRAQNVLIHEL